MKKILVATLVFLSSLCLSTSALAQIKEIRVLLANHPYGDLLKAAVPDFEKATGIRVKFEQLQESQLTTKLTTEFATRSSSVDVFMTRPLQEGKLFYKNGWYEPLNMDFADYPKNVMSVVYLRAESLHCSAGDGMAGALLPERSFPESRPQGSHELYRT